MYMMHGQQNIKFLKYVFIKRAYQNSSRFLPGMLMLCWLFLFAARGMWNRADVRAGQQQWCFVRLAE